MSDIVDDLKRQASKRFEDLDTETALDIAEEILGLRNALAAKDAEIERLRAEIDGWHEDLRSALDVLWRRGGDEAREWVRLNYPLWAASETHERAPEPPQDRRSWVSGHGEPSDTPTGDTRG